MKNEIETSDLYRGAYFMCCGGQLHEIRLTKNHRVAFVIEGDLAEEDIRFKTGQALVNPHQLRKFINYLRDLMEERKTHGKDSRCSHRANQTSQRFAARSPKTRY